MKTAVLGVGNMGRHHARVYAEMPDVELVAVADVSRTLGQQIAAKYGCKYYSNYRKLLDNENIDAVSIAVPTSLHKAVALECIKRNVPVLIEKPIADTVASAQAIIRSGEKRGVAVCVGHIERFNPSIQKLRKLIEEKRFGKIISISSKRVGLFPPQIKDTDVITDLAVHDIDICAFLLGIQPTTVNARAGRALNSKRYDYADIILGFNGIDVVIQVNWITPVKVRELSLIGTKGYAELNYLNQTLKIYKSNYEKKFDSYGDYIVKFGTPDAEMLNLAGTEPLQSEIKNFINFLSKKNGHVVSAREGLHALRIALKAARAAQRANHHA